MIVSDELLNKLRRAFGLNLYETKLWTALLSRGVSTAGELSDIADVPRSRTYDVLETLERKGFIMVKPEKPIRYLAIAPNEICDRVVRRLSETTEEKIKRLNELKDSDILKELSLLYKQGTEPLQPTDFCGTLKGRHNIYDHLISLLKEAQNQISIVTTEEGLNRKVRALKPLLEKAKAKGVKIKIIAPLTEKNKEAAKKLEGIAELKPVKEINSRFVIVDGKHILFMLTDDTKVHPAYDAGVWAQSSLFTSAVQEMFENFWKSKNGKEQ
ncbi:MAG: helix-turn-helix domain-containing protein [Candidatus Nanoarchaeia archaeon]